MFSGFDEASRDVTYFVWILPGGEPPNTMTLSLSSFHFFWLSNEKTVPLQHQNQERVRRVNVMNATYSNGMMAYAPAEATRLALFTPPL